MKNTFEIQTDAGVATVFESRDKWGWTLGDSEGAETTFEAAVAAAEKDGGQQAVLASFGDKKQMLIDAICNGELEIAENASADQYRSACEALLQSKKHC